MGLLGCSHDDMEGGQAFVRMDKLESDESYLKEETWEAYIFVFKDVLQSTLPNLRCWLLSPCNFGTVRVRSPAELVSLWNLKNVGKIRVLIRDPTSPRLTFLETDCDTSIDGSRWQQKQQHSNLPHGSAAEEAWNGRSYRKLWSGYCSSCFEK